VAEYSEAAVSEVNSNHGEPLPDGLRGLFASYREALPGLEPSSNFMPTMWSRIDARRNTAHSFGRLTRAFVSFAGALCLIISAIFLSPMSEAAPDYLASYVDVLAEDQDDSLEAQVSNGGER